LIFVKFGFSRLGSSDALPQLHVSRKSAIINALAWTW
jgi:hypothetical protein